MTTINYEQLDEHLQHIIQFAPTLQSLHAEDVSISISDLDTIVLQLQSKELEVENMLGSKLTSRDPMLSVMRSKQPQILTIPEELYGKAMKVAIAPILNAQQKVIGSIALVASINKQVELLQLAERFADSSTEISSATEQLAASANELTNHMTDVAEAQNMLRQQVENSAKILDIINNVAKNTRILGFNAGIEAARSGEHGRGFSVVAKEITKLADKSAESVNEIRNLLASMQEKVSAVEQKVMSTTAISEQQTAAIVEIANSIEKLTEAADDIDELAKKI